MNSSKLNEYCSAWRKGLRRVWELPGSFRGDYLSVLSGITPISDEMCRLFLNFITRCYFSDSEMIWFVVNHAVFFARASSPVGRNFVFCYERFGYQACTEFLVGSKCCSFKCIPDLQLTDIDFSNICLALEFVMLRAGRLHTPDCSLSRAELDSLLAFIGTRSRG